MMVAPADPPEHLAEILREILALTAHHPNDPGAEKPAGPADARDDSQQQPDVQE